MKENETTCTESESEFKRMLAEWKKQQKHV